MSIILKDKRRGLIQPQKSNPFESRGKAYANKPLSNDPSAQNPVYAYKTCLRCKFCGSRKRFSTAWKLYMHFKCHHGSEPSLLSTIQKVADAIIGEMR
jgi:hypothetical protein